MINNLHIVVDSGCDISNKYKDEHNITIVPLIIDLDNKIYVDDDTLNKKNLLEHMKTSSDIGKTSCPSPEKFLDAYEGHKNIIVITLSSNVSGTYNSAVLAKQLYLEQNPDTNIEIIDSYSAASCEVMILDHLIEIKDKYNDLSDLAIDLNKYAKELKTYFLLDDMDRLIRNGRIKGMKAFLVSKLNMKAIMTQKNGEICQADTARGTTKALSSLSKIIKKDLENLSPKSLYISHVNAIDKVTTLLENLKSLNILDMFKNVVINETRGLSTYYASEGGIIVTF